MVFVFKKPLALVDSILVELAFWHLPLAGPQRGTSLALTCWAATADKNSCQQKPHLQQRSGPLKLLKRTGGRAPCRSQLSLLVSAACHGTLPNDRKAPHLLPLHCEAVGLLNQVAEIHFACGTFASQQCPGL